MPKKQQPHRWRNESGNEFPDVSARTSRRFALTSRCCRAPFATASRWCTSTAAPPRSDRSVCLMRSGCSWSAPMLQFTVAPISSPKRQPTPTNRRELQSRTLWAQSLRNWCSPRTPPKPVNLVAYAMGNAATSGVGAERFKLGAGRPSRHHRDGAPLQPCPVAASL